MLLYTLIQRASLLKIDSTEIMVHYIPGYFPPMIRCNHDDSNGCSLCRAGYPSLLRYLIIMCDWPDSRLCTLTVPTNLKEELYEQAICLPENEWNFAFGWNGFEYSIFHLEGEEDDEFVRTLEEHAELAELAKLVDLDAAVPRLTNLAMLRLPAVMMAAAYFAIDGTDQSGFSYTESTAIRWRPPDDFPG
jgi:hypothetical protein